MYLLMGGCLVSLVSLGVLYGGTVTKSKRQARRMRRIGLCIFSLGAAMFVVAMFAYLFGMGNDSSRVPDESSSIATSPLA